MKVIREEANNTKTTYAIYEDPDKFIIYDKNNKKLATLNKSEVSSNLKEILNKIKEPIKGTFSIPIAEKLMNELFCHQIKASNKKADLFLELSDTNIVETSHYLGFSIKSRLGASPTLFNANKDATNFIYRIAQKRIDQEEINSIVGGHIIRKRLKKIEEKGAILEFSGMANENFEKNLRLIESKLPELIAEALKVFFNGKGNTLIENTNTLESGKILETRFAMPKNAYIHKLKNFLEAIALGMNASKEWDGEIKAHGGYIIVKQDGELVCYHLDNRDLFKEYLFNNTKFETPSTSRHKYGKVYEEKGEQFIKLNLQLRYIK